MLFIRVYFAFWKWNKKLHFFHWNQKLFMFSLPLERHKQWLWISCLSKLLRKLCWSISSEVQEILGHLFFSALSPTNLFLSIKIYFLSFLRLWWSPCLTKQRCFDEVSESHSTVYGWCLSLSIINSFSLASLWCSHREFLSWISILSWNITVEEFILQRFKVIGT